MVIDNYSAANDGFAFTYGATQTVVIGQPATFTASLDATCMIVTVDRAPFYTGANSTYFWNFGDGFTSTAGVPAPYAYASTGTYTISLTVTDAVGCITNYSLPVNIGCLLPIKLTSFDAQYSYGKVNVNWITETETNNDYFTVERSKDLKTFEVVDVVKSKNGNSNITQKYDLTDKNPLKGTSYYRLKQTDYDGQFEYFEPVAVTIKSTYDDVTVYPNPVSGNGYLTFSSLKDDEQTLVIYDVSGRIVYQKQYAITTGNNKLTLETTNLTKGMYFIKMDNAEDGINLKFIKE